MSVVDFNFRVSRATSELVSPGDVPLQIAGCRHPLPPATLHRYLCRLPRAVPEGGLPLSKLPYVLCAAAIGAVLTLQPALNAEVARRLVNPLGAGLVSMFVSFAL